MDELVRFEAAVRSGIYGPCLSSSNTYNTWRHDMLLGAKLLCVRALLDVRAGQEERALQTIATVLDVADEVRAHPEMRSKRALRYIEEDIDSALQHILDCSELSQAQQETLLRRLDKRKDTEPLKTTLIVEAAFRAAGVVDPSNDY